MIINDRTLLINTTLKDELQLEKNKNYLFNLSYLSVLQVIGERSSEFLQGQLTCDLREVNAQQMRQGALCDLKGRILTLMDVILDWVQNNILLILPLDLITETLRSLEKPALFSKVILKPIKQYQLFGFYYPNPQDLTPPHLLPPNKTLEITYTKECCCYYLSNNLYVYLVHHNASDTFSKPFIQNNQYRGSLSWHKLQLETKRISIYPNSRGLFLPHRLNLHLTGYINFNKGCYKGQEIIARTHYRAKLKHTLKTFIIKISEPLQSGQTLRCKKTNQEIGELIDYCPLDDQHFLITASVITEHPTLIQINNHKHAVILKEFFDHSQPN